MLLHGRVSFAAIILAALSVFGAAAISGATPRSVREIRFWTAEDHTRVVIELSGEARYSIRAVSGPKRIIVEIPGCRISPNVRDLDVRDGAIDRIRVNRMKTLAQVVFDLPREASFSHFPLKPSAGKPHRIVVDVSRESAAHTAAGTRGSAGAGAAVPQMPAGGAAGGSRAQERSVPYGGDRVIIIDAGHGGAAPGAISRSGIQEKTLNLKLAKMLKAEIDSRPGYRAVLTRDGDYDVHWVRRVSFAREKGGELFVSLHFNSNSSPKMRGLELYFLSLQASDDNAAAVAERENLLLEAGADSAGLNDDLKSILFDVSLANAIQRSSVLADEVALVLRADPPVPFRKVKQAPYIVLRGIAMPSILVEGGYLSNRKEASIIAKESYLSWLARSLAEGIISFLEKHPQSETAAGS
jgi:N-acetylmuramoyl-L-alanine amidase